MNQFDTADRIRRLPLWAQRYIRDLEKERDNHKHKLARLIEGLGPEDSNVFAEHWDIPPVPIGKDVAIKFALAGEAVIVKHTPGHTGELDISVDRASWHRPVLLPTCGGFKVRVEEKSW